MRSSPHLSELAGSLFPQAATSRMRDLHPLNAAESRVIDARESTNGRPLRHKASHSTLRWHGRCNGHQVTRRFQSSKLSLPSRIVGLSLCCSSRVHDRRSLCAAYAGVRDWATGDDSFGRGPTCQPISVIMTSHPPSNQFSYLRGTSHVREGLEPHWSLAKSTSPRNARDCCTSSTQYLWSAVSGALKRPSDLPHAKNARTAQCAFIPTAIPLAFRCNRRRCPSRCFVRKASKRLIGFSPCVTASVGQERIRHASLRRRLPFNT